MQRKLFLVLAVVANFVLTARSQTTLLALKAKPSNSSEF